MLKLPHISQCEELRRTIGKERAVMLCVSVRQKHIVPCCAVGVGLSEGGSSDWTSFLFLHPQAGDRKQFGYKCVCIICFLSHFLNLTIFCPHTQQIRSRFDSLSGPGKCSIRGATLSPRPPPSPPVPCIPQYSKCVCA